MSLWVKRMGQLFLAALFLLACEDENSLLGFKNPVTKFNINFIDIPLESSVVLIDSVRTDNQQLGTNRLMAGKYFDPLLGEVRATAFTQLRPENLDTISLFSTYDSLVLELQLDYYAYGSSGLTTESLSVHEIIEDSISYSLPFKPYYGKNKIGYGPSIGQVTYSLDYDSLKKYGAIPNPDTVFTVKLTLNENTDFGVRLFTIIRDNPDNTLKDAAKFTWAIKGLALAPADPSSSIVSLNKNFGSASKLTLHYHTATDTLSKIFYLDRGSFNNVETNRVGDLAGKGLYETIDPPSDLRYVQNGSTVMTRIDLENFYTQMESVPNTIINTAQLIIESVENPGDLAPPATIYLRTVKEDNTFYINRTTSEAEFMLPHWMVNDGEYYLARNDALSLPERSALQYKDGGYNAPLTMFFQDLFSKRNESERLKYLGLYSQDMGKTVNRVAFNKNNIKVRVYYTVPTNQ